MSEQRWSLDEVITILTNCGIDTTCPACIEVAFTGSTTGEHSCATPVKYPYGLEGLDALEPRGIAKLDDTEPLFTLRGQDMFAPEIVREWAYRSLKAGCAIEKVDGARRIADDMENWQIANDKRKVAD